MPTERSWLLVALAAVTLLGGCTAAPTEAPAPAGSNIPAAAPGPAPPAAAPSPAPTAPALQAGFAELAATIPAEIGIAYVPVGESTVSAFGKWTTGAAWSTSKVPLAIAALRADHAAAEPLAAKAITQSDNAAAEQLWSLLGPPEQAAQKMQDVLRENGDDTTVVQSQRVRAGFTAFGQTWWSLALQAQFAAQLPCRTDPETTQVRDWMANLSAGNWGLANDGAPTKGGWGPDESGGYLVRQLAIMTTTDNGQVGVALAAKADSFDAGVDALNRMASWLVAHKAELPAGHCPA